MTGTNSPQFHRRRRAEGAARLWREHLQRARARHRDCDSRCGGSAQSTGPICSAGCVALGRRCDDGTLARERSKVVTGWQHELVGEVLDLVVDFVTYGVPAYAIPRGGLLLPVGRRLLGIGIVIERASMSPHRSMKASDNHFRGFPALWTPPPFTCSCATADGRFQALARGPDCADNSRRFIVLHPIRVRAHALAGPCGWWAVGPGVRSTARQ